MYHVLNWTTGVVIQTCDTEQEARAYIEEYIKRPINIATCFQVVQVLAENFPKREWK